MLDLFQLLACDPDLAPLITLLKGVLNLIQVAIPIILIIMGSIDLGKAVISSDEKEIKAATSKLIKRCIAAVAVFLISTIVSLVMNLVANSDVSIGEEYTWKDCWNNNSAAANKN